MIETDDQALFINHNQKKENTYIIKEIEENEMLLQTETEAVLYSIVCNGL